MVTNYTEDGSTLQVCPLYYVKLNVRVFLLEGHTRLYSIALRLKTIHLCVCVHACVYVCPSSFESVRAYVIGAGVGLQFL